MAFLARFRANILSWWQDTPLPTGTPATFQSWHEFDEATNQWRAVNTTPDPPAPRINTHHPPDAPYQLITWNVDSSSPHPASRLSALLSHALALTPPPDILLLQELSPPALQHLLTLPCIRQTFLLSETTTPPPPSPSFTTLTLLSKSRFPHPGPVWRTAYPSRFARDALCCDVFATPSATTPGNPPVRIRLVNVHLDSLPIQPSLRPGQVATAAALLRSAGRGIVAGDFNPVLPGDEGLMKENGLVDAWRELRPAEDGFTWGVDGTEPFPPCRMDKVGVVGLRVGGIEVVMPGGLDGEGEGVRWSDHSGVKCWFEMVAGGGEGGGL